MPKQAKAKQHKRSVGPMFAHIDCISRRAWVGGQERVFNDQFGGGFDSSALSAGGMDILSTNTNRPVAAGTLATALAGPNIGVAIDWLDVETPAGDNGNVRLMQWSDDIDPSNAANIVTLYARYLDNSVFADDWDSLFVSTAQGAIVPGVINRAIFNLGRPSGVSHLSEVGADGHALSQSSLSYAFAAAPIVALGFELQHSPSLTTAVLGGTIRHITVFPTA
jgi:hypothetical protein